MTALTAARRDSAFYRGIYPPWGSASRLLYQSLRTAYVPDALRRMRKGVRRHAEVRRNIGESIIAPEFARRIDLAGRLELLSSHGRTTPWGTLREEHARNVLSPYITVAVERYDRVSAAYGVEARHPFLDKRVIELCLSLPWDQKFGHGWPKRILRHAMAGTLPDAVRWRRSAWEHLGWAFWAALLGLERHLMDQVVQGGLATVSPFVDAAAVRTAYRRYRATGDIDAGIKVWEATALSSWLGRAGRTESTSLAAG
jgi:asparagine synthase (glutamine-hydrolysing)